MTDTGVWEPSERLLGIANLAAAIGVPLGTAKRRLNRDRQLLEGLTPTEQMEMVAKRGLRMPPPDVVIGAAEVVAYGWYAETAEEWNGSGSSRVYDLEYWALRRWQLAADRQAEPMVAGVYR